MTVDLRNLTTKVLDVQIIPPPTALNGMVLRQLFTDLANFELEVYNPTPDGGAVLSNPALQRQVVMTPALRQVILPIQVDAYRTLQDVVDIFNMAQSRAQAPLYLACAVSVVSHLPVTGESAADLLQRKAFSNQDAFSALGPGIKGVGLRVFMSGAGPLTFTVEPLLADLGKMVINLQQMIPGNFQLHDLKGKCEAVLHFHDNQLKNFLEHLLVNH